MLGITLENNLTWEFHVSQHCKYLIPILYRRMKQISGSRTTLTAYYYSLFESHLIKFSCGIVNFTTRTENDVFKGEIVINIRGDSQAQKKHDKGPKRHFWADMNNTVHHNTSNKTKTIKNT